MRREILAASIAVLLLMATAVDVSSRSGGITGQAQGGCTCHNVMPSTNVLPAISGLPVTWTTSTSYPITVSFAGGPAFSPNPDRVNTGGFNLQVTGGGLSAVPSGGTAAVSGVGGREATQTTFGNDQTAWSLVWNSPASGYGNGTISFYLATNSVNGDGLNSAADEWNKIAASVTGPADETAPVITNVTAAAVSTVSATITWRTDDDSDSAVDYGTTAAYGSTATSSEPVPSHSVTLTGLTGSTTYHYRVRSTNLNGLSSESGDFTFTTSSDTQPPTVAINRPATGRVYFNDAEVNAFTGRPPLAMGSTLSVLIFSFDASGVSAVETYVDSLATKRGDATRTSPTGNSWAWQWPLSGEAAGEHILYAKSYDSAGNTKVASVTVTIIPF